MEIPGSGSGSGGAGGGVTLEVVEFSMLLLLVGRTARGGGGATVSDLQPRAPTNPTLNPTLQFQNSGTGRAGAHEGNMGLQD